ARRLPISKCDGIACWFKRSQNTFGSYNEDSHRYMGRLENGSEPDVPHDPVALKRRLQQGIFRTGSTAMSGPAPIAAIAFIGFGEAGGILGAALAAQGVRVSMFDVRRDVLRDKALAAGVRVGDSMRDALDGAQIVVSAVTAEADLEVAQAAASCIDPQQI